MSIDRPDRENRQVSENKPEAQEGSTPTVRDVLSQEDQILAAPATPPAGFTVVSGDISETPGPSEGNPIINSLV